MNIHLPFPYDGNQVCGGLLSSISSDFLGGIHGPHLISLPEHRTQRGVPASKNWWLHGCTPT